jgi:hypothetical protein
LILQNHLKGESSIHALFAFKIIDEIFKDQREMTQLITPLVLPDMVWNFIFYMRVYIQNEVFCIRDDSNFQKDVESLCEYTLDEDQHYVNITQAIIIKFIDILQSVTFTQDTNLVQFLQQGSPFLVNIFFHLLMMNQEDIFLWKEEPSQYIEDDEDETNLYAIKPAVISCLYSLIERFPELYTQSMIDIADIYTERFIAVVRSSGVSVFPLLFLKNSEIYDSNSSSLNNVFKELQFDISKTEIFKKIWKFICMLNPTKKNDFMFLFNLDHLLDSLPRKVKIFTNFSDHWKKMESTFLLIVTFIKDIMTLNPANESKLNHYGQICIELLNLPMTEVLTGRAIWAVSTLKHFSSSDEEFLNIYALVCRFLNPKTTLCVRLCASRTITKMSFRIASENKQGLVAQKIGEQMRQLHSWVVDLMKQADERTYHMIIDNLISFYDMCPQLLEQELTEQHCQLFLQIFRNHYQNSILISCFLQLLKKISTNSSSLMKCWSSLVMLTNSFIDDSLKCKNQNLNQFEFENKIETVMILVDLCGHYGILLYFF